MPALLLTSWRMRGRRVTMPDPLGKKSLNGSLIHTTTRKQEYIQLKVWKSRESNFCWKLSLSLMPHQMPQNKRLHVAVCALLIEGKDRLTALFIINSAWMKRKCVSLLPHLAADTLICMETIDRTVIMSRPLTAQPRGLQLCVCRVSGKHWAQFQHKVRKAKRTLEDNCPLLTEQSGRYATAIPILFPHLFL